jgi:hypothetical protein
MVEGAPVKLFTCGILLASIVSGCATEAGSGPGSRAAAEKKFVHAMRYDWDAAVYDPPALVAEGHDICEALRAGETFDEIQSGLLGDQNVGFSGPETVEAVQYLCPQWWPAHRGEGTARAVEKANHSAAQRWRRGLPDDLSVLEAQARLDAEVLSAVVSVRRRMEGAARCRGGRDCCGGAGACGVAGSLPTLAQCTGCR